MASCHQHALTLLLMTVVVSIAPTISHALGFTFDECDTPPDCAVHLICLSTKRRGGNRLRTCDGDSDCLCLPVPNFTYCTRATDCRLGEDCAESSKTGSRLCVSCARAARRDVETVYTRLFPQSAQCEVRMPAPPVVPPTGGANTRGRSYDLCSTAAPCLRRLQCLQSDGRPCGRSSVPCFCIPNAPAQCSSSAQCGRNEACAASSLTGLTECVSCTILQQDIQLTMVDSAPCAEPIFGVPEYAPQANGLAHDTCTSDVVCKAPLKCLQKVGAGTAPCTSAHRGNCFCLKESLDGCSKTSDCAVIGEVCARLHKSSRRQCVSANYLQILPKRKYKLYDSRQLPKPAVGDGLTGSACKVDWDCSGGRRCTHLEDRFGGCAQRSGCACQPLFLRSCTGSGACDDGEVCAEYAGARSRPFCVSMKAFGSGRFAFLKRRNGQYDYPDVSGRGRTQLTGDYCTAQRDCVASLTCRHFTEDAGACRGRKACVCKPGKDADVWKIPGWKGVLVGQKCGSAADCRDGEKCVRLIDGIRTLASAVSGSCLSASQVRSELYVEVTRR